MVLAKNNKISYEHPSYDEFAKARMLSQVSLTSKGCWIWKGCCDKDGYGQLRYKGKMVRAIRLSWVLFGKKELIPGMVLDHIGCDTPSCINPDHLRQVTVKENNERSDSPFAINGRKIKCIRGHTFDKENTLYRKNGARICRQCKKICEKVSSKIEVSTVV